MVAESEQLNTRIEATTESGRDSGNRLNLLDLISDRQLNRGGASEPAPVTREYLHDALRQTDHVRIHTLNTPEKIQQQEDQINALEDRDLEAIGDIAGVLGAEPRGQIDQAKAQQLDEIFKQYACFPERLRNMLNPLELHLQRQGLDVMSNPQTGLSVDGGYPNWPDDRSQYRVQINGDRTPQPLYQFNTNEVCS